MMVSWLRRRDDRDGPADPHDILRLLGIEALARYITDEVQEYTGCKA